FSKGCVVLNQFLREIHFLQLPPEEQREEGRPLGSEGEGGSQENEASPLLAHDVIRDGQAMLRSIRSLVWIDSGHNGGLDVWCNDRGLIESLSRTGIQVEVHLTPYQIQDDRRPHIRKEEKKFGAILKQFKVRQGSAPSSSSS
ncbi:unnamed protein product, partial [Cyprideis torosa]